MEIVVDFADSDTESALWNLGFALGFDAVTGFTSFGLRTALKETGIEPWMKQAIEGW
jgi:hypothetical protein